MLAVELEKMFGENGYAMLVDEGGMFSLLSEGFHLDWHITESYGEQFGRVTTTVGITEKGCANIRVEVNHSGLPSPHTVGRLSP